MFNFFQSKTPIEQLKARITNESRTIFKHSFRKYSSRNEMEMSLIILAAYTNTLELFKENEHYILCKKKFKLSEDFTKSDFDSLVDSIVNEQVSKYIVLPSLKEENDFCKPDFYDF